MEKGGETVRIVRMMKEIEKGVKKPLEDRRGDVPFWIIGVIVALVIGAALIKVAIDQMTSVSSSSTQATNTLNKELANASNI